MKSSSLIMFICSGLLLSGGAMLGGSAAWSLLRMSYYFWITDLGVELSSTVIFISGALLCLPTCWLATILPYHTKSLSLATALVALSMATMLMLSLGMTSASGLSRALREPDALNTSMLRAMPHAGFDPAVRSSFSAMQIELKCCGIQSSSDWYQHRRNLPQSCCGRSWNSKRNDQCVSPLFTVGCLRPAFLELRNYVNSVTFLASAIIFTLSVTLFTGSYIMVSEALKRAERCKPQPQREPLRIACLQPQLYHAPAPVHHAPLLTAPNAV